MTSRTRILLISDLHLEEERPDLTRAFHDFLQRETPSAFALYVLGDFFNVWIGDDDDRPLNREISAALKQQADQGLAIYLMHGNRDFFLGADFAESAGATLIEEPYRLTVGDQHYLLLHGDMLCTKDLPYLQFRTMVRNPEWQQNFLASPLAERRAFANKAREQSRNISSNKASDIMDVTQQEVETLLGESGVHTMIHGHTHRPAVHEFKVADRACQRIVLGDWGQDLWYVALEENTSPILRQIPIG